MFNRNPTIIISGLSGLLQQILPLLVIMGWLHLTPEKLAAVIALQGLVLTFLATTILRSQVVPTETRNAQVQLAIDSPSSTTVEKVVKKEEANREV